MQLVDEFRDPLLAKKVVDHINAVFAELPYSRERPLQIMEVCGGHTHTIFKFGLDQLLPDGIEFVHGPGCPVCVLPMSRLDDFMTLGEAEKTILCTFGDAMRVPGTNGSLLDANARGYQVRIVYSPLDALTIAKENPDHEIIFFGLGFETTMPSTAMTLKQAKQQGVTNFSLFCQHITIAPTLKALLEQADIRIDGFLLPGHVSMIVGSEPYQFIARDFQKPSVITGFEPLDVLQSILMLLEQFRDQRCEIGNQYQRVVARQGNPMALKAMAEVFTAKHSSLWRGLGHIADSGIQLTPDYAEFDAEQKFTIDPSTSVEPEACRCGDVLTGRCKPIDCPLFGNQCTPTNAIGALMVSSEGACAAYYQYRLEVN
ncbi:hydrogenase formation protein HypD [Photobacterium lipolyticum]|uniref:Hydrogenase maturation factor n=1 Tax=Photobacterium lipolyticum TaxID=266810 RepID=A0A2T3MWD9_9GAMM|nr:hydrogenase formation protein HypD [Photobacterium lipolyticum]PSW04206.1 hydrogenase formation protein HypD [Photobacterium lipolyticum]